MFHAFGWIKLEHCKQKNRVIGLMADCSARLAGIDVGGPARIKPSGDFGLVGLAVMGQNLILNIADHGFTVVAFNRTVAKVDKFLANEAKGAWFLIVKDYLRRLIL